MVNRVEGPHREHHGTCLICFQCFRCLSILIFHIHSLKLAIYIGDFLLGMFVNFI